MKSIILTHIVFIIINVSCDLLFPKIIFENQATLTEILPVDENEQNEAPPKAQKDNKPLQDATKRTISYEEKTVGRM